MPLLRITASQTGPALYGSAAPLLPRLREALAEDGGPVMIMVHGYRYLPGDPLNCPFTGILALNPERGGARTLSWPRHLGLRGQRGEGLGISFGWSARGSIRKAFASAAVAGVALAELLTMIRSLAPERPVHLVGHSMGARVILQAVQASLPGTVRTAILLAAADFQSSAERALDAAGPGFRLLNVTSRENDLFDLALRACIRKPCRGDQMLGHGSLAHPSLATLQLDDARTLEALAGLGHPVAPPLRRICHWSPYLRPGVFPLYRALMAERLDWSLLKSVLCGPGRARSWPCLLPLAQTWAGRRAIGQI